MATVGNLKVDLGLDSAAFDVGLKNAGKGMDGLAKRAAVMGAAIAAAVTAAAGAFTAIVMKTSEAANATGDMADMLGLNVEALQELRHAADRGGMGMQNFDVAMRRFIRRSAEAANGTGAAKGAFKELGIELRTTDGRLKDSEALLAEVADAMEGVQSPADKLRLAFQMFDTDGAKMVNVLAGGSEELERLREEARKLGIVLDEDTIRAAQRFQDNLDTLRKGAEAFANRLTAMALPAFVAITNAMINFSAHVSDAAGALFEFARYAGVASAAVLGIVGPAVVAGINALAVAIGTRLVAAVAAFNAMLMANPMLGWIGAISATVAALVIFRDEFARILGFDIFTVIRDTTNSFIGAFVGAYDAIVAVWNQLPGQFGRIGKLAWNALLDGLSGDVITWTPPWGGDTVTLFDLDLSGFKQELDETEQHAAGLAEAAYNAAQGVNYLGNATEWFFGNSDDAIQSINDLGVALDDGSGGGVAGAAKKTKEALSQMGDIGGQVTNRLATGFTDLFEAAITGGKNLLEIVGNVIRDLGRMFLHEGFKSLLGMGGGGLFGGLFSGIGKLFGFARGGTIMPGGAGGIDSQLVMFRKSPNERVDITKPGQTLTSGDSGPSELNFNITVSGARGNTEIQQMVEQGMDSALQTVRQHLPDWVANPRVKFV